MLKGIRDGENVLYVFNTCIRYVNVVYFQTTKNYVNQESLPLYTYMYVTGSSFIK